MPAPALDRVAMDREPYDPRYFHDLAEAERTHFWFVHRNHVLEWCARRFAPAEVRRVLEVGCGTGNVLALLEGVWPQAHVVGMELFEEGLQFARARVRASLVCARIEEMPFAGPFDVVGMFDVLEHIRSDVPALSRVRDVMHAKSRLLLSVPAYARLWSEFDVRAGHVRRYNRRSLGGALEQAGFRLEYLTPFMMPLLPLVWIHRRVSARTGGDMIREELQVNPWVNAVCRAVLSAEAAWLHTGARVAAGTSLLAVARRD